MMNMKKLNAPVDVFDELAEIEASLARNLVMLEPRNEFVKSLRGQLLNSFHRDTGRLVVEARPKKIVNLVLVGVAGFASSIILLITSIRAVVALVNAIGSLRQNKDLVASKPSAPMTPVS